MCRHGGLAPTSTTESSLEIYLYKEIPENKNSGAPRTGFKSRQMNYRGLSDCVKLAPLDYCLCLCVTGGHYPLEWINFWSCTPECRRGYAHTHVYIYIYIYIYIYMCVFTQKQVDTCPGRVCTLTLGIGSLYLYRHT